MSEQGGSTGEGAGSATRSSVKETITSIVIAFALAFVFRGFVVEAYVIPTGSMAPTLRGQHMQFRDPENGYDWAVGPQFHSGGVPTGVQGVGGARVRVWDPMTWAQQERERVALRSGDRIFVTKYLEPLAGPRRWDCVVFKNPNDPAMNYIKRLIGLPGEEIALVDGDVFVRPWREGEDTGGDTWTLPGWKVAEKPVRSQEAMWLAVYDSSYAPLRAERDGRVWFRSPWVGGGEGAAWAFEAGGVIRLTSDAGLLAWDHQSRPILDAYAYNQDGQQNTRTGVPGAMAQWFPVSDVRVRAGVKPLRDGGSVRAVLEARRHEFVFAIEGGKASVRMRAEGGETWTEVVSEDVPALRAGVVTNVEFWHVDQTVQVWVDGERVAHGVYAWTPAERLRNVLGVEMGEVERAPALVRDGARYAVARVRWEFAGSAVELHRVGLDRDVHYQATDYRASNDQGRTHSRAGLPALATHPRSALRLGPDQFFTCGDNSPNSLDARLWDRPHPWIAQIDRTVGVVHRDLLIGRAFYVYWPAPGGFLGIMPDAGKMRWIW